MAKNIKIKPGKGYEKVALAAGVAVIVVSVIGFIPMMRSGLFSRMGFAPIMAMIVPVVMILIVLRNASSQGLPFYELNIDEDNDGIPSRLRQLDTLYNQGLISRDEYDKKRKEILDRI